MARLQSKPCEQALASEARQLPGSLAGYHVRGATVVGRTARVTVEGRTTGRDVVDLTAIRQRWLITSAPGLGG